MKVNENTSISMPVKNMLAIIFGVVAGVFAYTELTARLVSLETSRELMQADLLKASDQKPVDQEQFMLLESLFSDVEKTIKSCRLSRDVIRVESLGVLEHVVLCKLGTDAVGLIPKLGRYLKSAVLVPFSPKNIIKEIGSQPFDD